MRAVLDCLLRAVSGARLLLGIVRCWGRSPLGRSALILVPVVCVAGRRISMSYKPPVLNLKCNVWAISPGVPPHLPAGAPRIANLDCQLCWGRVNELSEESAGLSMHLKVPAGTDIRGLYQNNVPDVVEVPAGTGRTYLVLYVDDVGRGFSNEYRQAVISAQPFATFNPIPWP